MKSQSELLNEMLANVPDDQDKRVGSPIYSALAPVAAMLTEVLFYGNQIADTTMADTATGLCQTRAYAEFGVKRIPATTAIRKGVFTPSKVAIGSRFSGGGVSYTVLGELESDGWQLRCEKDGEIGNGYVGAILPLDNLNPQLESAVLTDVVVYGREEEDDESFRIRFYDETRYPEHGWNKQGYRKEIRKIAGVGDVAVFPTPGGQGGRVHCVIVDPLNAPASDMLIQSVQGLLDPAPQGEGNGLVPPGHTVTVTTVAQQAISISAAIAIKAGFTLNSLRSSVEGAIANYFQKIAFVDSIVRRSQIETAILAVEGVMDISGTTINGGTANIVLSASWQSYEVPTLGTLTLEVLSNV